MIHPRAWENERRVAEITQPIPASEWAQKATQPGDELETLPHDSLIEEGRHAGGRVIMLHTDDSTYLFAVPRRSYRSSGDAAGRPGHGAGGAMT
jgi:hypothetical protein